MIDIQSELLAIESEWDSKYISIADLLYYLKNGNENIGYKDIATVLLRKLSKLNVDLIDWYDEYPEAQLEPNPRGYIAENYGICTYRRGNDNSAISLVWWRDNLFFDFLTCIKNSTANLEYIKLSLDEFDIKQVNAKDVFVEVEKIEKELNIIIPQDRESYGYIKGALQDVRNTAHNQRKFEQLKEENKQLKSRIEELNKKSISSLQTNRIAELEQQLEELKQKLEQSKQLPPMEEDSKSYNPTERETHLQMIYGLSCLLSKREINHQRYIRGGNINKSMIASDLERELQGIFTTPKTADGFRKRLTDILR